MAHSRTPHCTCCCWHACRTLNCIPCWLLQAKGLSAEYMRATNSSKDAGDPYADLKATISSLKAEKQQMQVGAGT